MRTTIKALFAITFVWSFVAHARPLEPAFYSRKGSEVVVEFEAVHRLDIDLQTLNAMSPEEKSSLEKYSLNPTLDYLFGPMNRSSMGGPQRVNSLTVKWDQAVSKGTGVEVPFHYSGQWLITKVLANQKQILIPLPYNKKLAFSKEWKACGDSDPEHQTESFFWYFWDPSRYGCDQEEGVHYQTIRAAVKSQTPQETESYPEYERLVRDVNGQKTLAMTFAFGYVDDKHQLNPFTDWDVGAREFQAFVMSARGRMFPAQESLILLGEYLGREGDSTPIGVRFEKESGGVHIIVNVVVNFKIDQMDLFAQSYGHKHEGLFAWFGHSRVGSGFDADMFRWKLQGDPDYYSISPEYQVIYWAGCHSYSYYTLPFFKMKATSLDPLGTKQLDIVSNALPSLFLFNAENAYFALEAFLPGSRRTSYQSLITQIENYAHGYGTTVLANVLGDEDNNKN